MGTQITNNNNNNNQKYLKKPNIIEITITDIETKYNSRQIHTMLYTLKNKYKVIKLHRINYMGIKIGNKKNSLLQQPGDWMYMNDSEMRLVNQVIIQSII